jgi:hypothetical protein
MSFAALAWAAKQKTGGLATKSVLLALANYADEHGCAYPSTAAIAEFGEMDHKTATVALDRLIAAGLIADSGQRAGRTKQVKVYRLNLESLSEPKAPQKRGTDTVREPIPQKATPSSGKRAMPAKPVMSLLPADFQPIMKPGSITATTVDGWPPGRLEDELEHFADHHTVKATLSADWQASWRTWVKNSKKWEPLNAIRPANDRHFRPGRSDRSSEIDDAARNLGFGG